MASKRVNIISLGCSKNLVDTERLLKRLEDVGFDAVSDKKTRHGDIVIVNTCGFIGDAKEESINTILECVEAKRRRQIDKIFVMGCLSERYLDELTSEIDEVDGWYGKFNWNKIISTLSDIKSNTLEYDRKLTTPPYSAYIKIAEGCNRFCAFCAIPIITGRFKSRPIEEILSEVKLLASRGVVEFNVIAQDLSSYGKDIYGCLKLAELIDKMAEVDGVKWIRLHYAYPTEFPYDVLDVMARRKNVCNYLDIALQHINDHVLANMNRHITTSETRRLIERIRKSVPNIHLRTTLMVGFPGEDEAAFDELLDFTQEMRFERMGAFAYCEEDGTSAQKNFIDSIPEDVKSARLDKLMALQEEISMELNQQKVGSIIEVLIEGKEGDYYVGRSEYDSPEVDPVVLVKSNSPLKNGVFYPIKITSAMPFELLGELANV
ncbi:MAG: 30S ribosomal protein S12 methylthiotransferase RimO [Bacteroidales bacterium]|nr:30S ribosomal protein S12 methylthiotransferase RimO [Bacteroidales bacterium]MBQ4292454.1 30S ribosomal protein S12 methylthiotransferase RimO [Muribaculaceae bacterium]